MCRWIIESADWLALLPLLRCVSSSSLYTLLFFPSLSHVFSLVNTYFFTLSLSSLWAPLSHPLTTHSIDSTVGQCRVQTGLSWSSPASCITVGCWVLKYCMCWSILPVWPGIPSHMYSRQSESDSRGGSERREIKEEKERGQNRQERNTVCSPPD